jgi:hypothetical protein
VEFGLTSIDWVALPPDPGSAAVLARGVRILLDRDGALLRIVQLVRAGSTRSDA